MAAGPREVRVDTQLSGHTRWSLSHQVFSGRALISLPFIYYLILSASPDTAAVWVKLMIIMDLS